MSENQNLRRKKKFKIELPLTYKIKIENTLDNTKGLI